MTGILKKQKTEQKMSVRYFEGLNLWILAAVFVANIFFQLSEVSSSLFLYAGTFVLIGMLFVLDKDEYIYLTVSLLSVLRFSKIFNLSVINIITFAYFFKAYIFENRYKIGKKKKQLPGNLVVAGTVFILFSLIHIISSIKTTLTVVKLLFFLIYMVDVFRNMKNKEDAEKKFINIQVYYVAGVLIAIFVSLVFNPTFSREAARMSLSDGAVNQLGISLTSCLAFVTLGMTKVTNIKEWTVLAITAIPLLYFCFETQSRTSIVGLIFVFASTMILGVSQKKSRSWVLMMGIASVAVFAGLALFTEGTDFHENFMATIDRFVNPKNDDISNGRFDLWKQYTNKLFTDYKLFLWGGERSNYSNMQAHNMFLETFSTFGFFGFCIFAWVYIVVFNEIRETLKKLGKRKIRLLGFVPFVLVFLLGVASHTLQNTEPTVNFCLGTAMIYLYGESDEERENYVDNREDTTFKPFSKRKRLKNIRGMGYCHR